MRKLVHTWLLLIGLALAASVSAWAAPTVTSLTTPVLPANAAVTSINNLVASAGTPTSYRITSVPGGGTLYVNGTAVTAARNLTPTQATQLSFLPSGTAGNYSFTFTASDASGASAAATYAISVGQATCGQAAGFDFSTRTVGETWQARPNVSAGTVTISTSGYSASPGTNRFQIGNDQNGAHSNALSWFTNYNTQSASTSTVTFTFSRALIGFTIVVQDIDANTAGSSAFVDQLQFDGYVNNTTNTPIALTSANVRLGSTNVYSGSNRVTGTANSDANPADNVIVTFPQAITRLVLTYRNTQTVASSPTQQGLGIPSFGWCGEADIATTLTGPTRAQAGNSVNYTVTTTNNGPDVVTSVTPTLQLPANLTGLGASNGGTYSSSTGLVTFPTISSLAVGSSTTNILRFTMPANNSVTGTATYSSSVLDNVSSNNTATLSTAQNQAPTANNVTNSPAMLSTNGATAIAALSATDPDGNNTIASYTIISLPAASQGVLYVNGTTATAGQSLTPAQIAQLTFAPNGAFTGNATFTFSATDDLGVVSNTATYTVPVTAGADLATIISGSATGVVGQSRFYSATTTNLSSGPASNVVVTITLSNRPPFSTVTVNNGSYNPTTGVVTFNPVTLAGGAQVQNSVNFIAQASPSTITGTAASTSSTADPNAANNNGTAANATITTAISPVGPAATAAQIAPCATPGRDGSLTALAVNPNAYYPADTINNQTVAVNATSLVVGRARGTQTPIAVGDLVLIIQMQGADLDATNTDSYGDGLAGGLATGNLNNSNFTAGQYEYAVAANSLTVNGGTLTLTQGLKNGYQNAAATSTNGQRRFQVIRIPQYADLTLGANLTALRWNGRTGGIIVLDVTGRLAFNGYRIDATGTGFRGGAGRALGGAAGLSGTDYRTLATLAANGMKGEGVAGTPRYVNTGSALLDTGVEGYTNGSAGRGAPGNAGGGGTDANPLANNQNSGGGGGGNGARGGRGGNSATSNTAVGGEQGSAFGPPSTSRLILGGGGGAGVNKMASDGLAGYNSSGAAGGGIVLVRTGSVSGTGTIVANGASASSTLVNDGSGGAGAGGSILVTANNGTSLGSLTLRADGGSGGSNSASTTYGPGGGGGGGIILTNAAVANAYATGGQNGTTTGGVAYGADPGVTGLINTQVSASIQNSNAGINCSVDVVATISGPSAAAAGQTVTLSVVFANNGGLSASSVTRQVTLPASVSSTSVTATGGTITTDASNNVIITYPTLGALAAGASNSFGLSYTAPGVASVAATATVGTSTTPEPVTGNNTATTTTAITGSADIVSALLGLNTLNAGRPSGVYSVAFANNGPAAAANVTRTVTLPLGVAASDLTVWDGVTYTYNSSTGVIDFGSVSYLNSRDAQIFRFSFVAPTSGSTATIQSNTTTTSDQGSNAAADVFTITATINNVADVASTVSPTAGTVVAGEQGRFEIGFLNYGPSTSTGVLRRVQLPAGLTNVNATNGGTYNAVTGIVTYAATADLPNGGNASSVITFTAPASGVVTATTNMNDAVIFSGNSDNNQATGTITIISRADVATQLSGPTSTVAGNLVLFSVTTGNNGPSPATNVVQTVTLPSNLAGVFASDGGVYNASTGVVTFPALDVLASGQSVTRTLNVVAPTANFTATAAVTTSTTEPSGATANNTASASVSTSAATTALANLYTTVDLSAKNVAAGTTEIFTAVVGNNGPQAATNVVQQVALRPGLTDVVISDNGSYNSTTGIVTFPVIASLASSNSVTRTISVTAPAVGLLTATSNVTSATSDPMPADNMAAAIVIITPVADVTTTLFGPSTASAGQKITLTVNTINNGAVAARNVVQNVTIPAGIDLSDVTISDPSATYDPLTGLVTFPAIVAQLSGNVVTNSITYKMPAYRSTDTNAPRTFENRATVSTNSAESVVTNNQASVLTEVKWNADVAVTVAGPNTTVLGNPVLYTVSTVNNGPGAAASVTTRVRIVTGLTGVVASGGGVYDSQTGIVTFPTITNQPAGVTGAVTNTISFLVPDRPIIGIGAVADVPSATNDANLNNNAATIISPVRSATATQVDLQTTITSDVTQQIAGQPIVLTVTSTNNSSIISSSRERVSLPAGLANVVVRQGSTVLTDAYNAASGIVTFPATDLGANATSTYTITVSNPGNDPLVATASVNGTYSDPTPANNIQTVSITIIPAVDVLTRLNGPTTVQPGTLATYQVVTLNNGPSPASSVVQTVQLPTGLSNVTISGGGTYDAASGLVTFPTLATEAIGIAGEVTNTITFPAPNAAYTLTARVTTSTTEVANSTANNTATINAVLIDALPVASDRLNRLQTPQGNTANALLISALTGFTPTGTPSAYQLTAVPPASQGVLSLSGSPVTVSQTLTLADISNLSFAPNSSFVGNAFFAYTTTDDSGIQSAPARYTITVGRDNPSLYTPMAPKGGSSNPYQDNDVIANVVDINGANYDASAAMTNNGVRSAVLTAGSNPLPAGVGLDPNTGQLYVNDRTLLVTSPYTVNITTTDAYGGITSQPVAFSIGANPLPVELTVFAAKAQAQNAVLTWSTASEKNNDHFVIERSLDGRTFAKAGTVRGNGTTLVAHAYSFVDQGAARFGQLLYYRLRQVDADSAVQYTPARTVNFPTTATKVEISLYPNPAANATTLDLTMLPVGTYTVTLIDMTGRSARQFTVQGGLQTPLDLTNLSAATYVVVVQGQDTNRSLRLIKHD